MLPRLAILFAFFSFLNNASAQFFNPAGSMMAQQCPYPYQVAPQLANYPGQQDDFRRMAQYSRENELAIAEDIKKKMDEINAAKKGVYGRLTAPAARVVFKHLQARGDGGNLVNCDGPADYRRQPAPRYSPNAPLTCPPQVAPQLPQLLQRQHHRRRLRWKLQQRRFVRAPSLNNKHHLRLVLRRLRFQLWIRQNALAIFQLNVSACRHR